MTGGTEEEARAFREHLDADVEEGADTPVEEAVADASEPDRTLVAGLRPSRLPVGATAGTLITDLSPTAAQSTPRTTAV